jgi:hypothetical protein
MLKLTRLLNADGEVVGYFSDHVAEMAARREWNEQDHEHAWRIGLNVPMCRSIDTPIVSAELEDVEPGDGDRVEHRLHEIDANWVPQERIQQWLTRGAASVSVERYPINRYRRLGMSSRDADLGGLAEAAHVLYVLKIKAPK